MQKLIQAIESNLTDDLKKKEFRGGHPMAGHCYVASEVLFHLLEKNAQPMQMRHEGVSHWWLDVDGEVVDITAAQFRTTPNYKQGRRRSFFTKEPSKRAVKLMTRIENDCRGTN